MKTEEFAISSMQQRPDGATVAVRRGVMQLTDTLIASGYERVAVNLANELPANCYRSYLCTTRADGPLAELVAPHVGRLRLQRTSSFDLGAVRQLVSYVRQNQIEILHAHGTTVFISILASYFWPRPAIIWHNHAGRLAAIEHPKLHWQVAARCVHGTIVASRPLADWCVRILGMSSNRVWYIPNFVRLPDRAQPAGGLPGQPGSRIVSVANLLPDKDPLNLLRSMKTVAREWPTAHLILVGCPGDSGYMTRVRAELADTVLQGRVSMLGVRTDVTSILRACDIGVLASATEAMPLALVEYGMAGLPAVATRVGQCEEILDDGRVGLIVPPSTPDELSRAILSLLASPARRAELGRSFQQYVKEKFSEQQVLPRIGEVYSAVLDSQKKVLRAGAARP
jgi:glycosyltransferase involved in cell wall biosynthesis